MANSGFFGFAQRAIKSYALSGCKWKKFIEVHYWEKVLKQLQPVFRRDIAMLSKIAKESRQIFDPSKLIGLQNGQKPLAMKGQWCETRLDFFLRNVLYSNKLNVNSLKCSYRE